jgi:hypothetical protein
MCPGNGEFASGHYEPREILARTSLYKMIAGTANKAGCNFLRVPTAPSNTDRTTVPKQIQPTPVYDFDFEEKNSGEAPYYPVHSDGLSKHCERWNKVGVCCACGIERHRDFGKNRTLAKGAQSAAPETAHRAAPRYFACARCESAFAPRAPRGFFACARSSAFAPRAPRAPRNLGAPRRERKARLALACVRCDSAFAPRAPRGFFACSRSSAFAPRAPRFFGAPRDLGAPRRKRKARLSYRVTTRASARAHDRAHRRQTHCRHRGAPRGP